MGGKPKPEARLHAIVRGRVQGVNFRYYTLRGAERLDLTGWVANRWDGTVEAVAEGRRDALNKFRVFLQQGPPASWVQRVDVEWEAPTARFDRFKVRYL